MTICRLCYSSKFRCSHIRANEILKLLSLQFPVRCRNCGKRRFAAFWEAWAIHRQPSELNSENSAPVSK
jgi:hypothetical protein